MVSMLVKGSDALAPLASLRVRLPSGEEAFVLRLSSGEFAAYENRCPHWNVDLDMGLGDFIDPRTGFITCRNHLAEFEAHSGLCISGPCVGEALYPIAVSSEDGLAKLHLETR